MNRRYIAAAAIVIAAIGAGCLTASTQSQPPRVSSQATPEAAPSAALDISQAFTDGYRAYQRHDLGVAAYRLGYAAAHFPSLGDYALFYLGQTERDRGNLEAALAAFRRLVGTYPESVMVPQAKLALAQVYLRMGRNQDAARAAREVIASTREKPVEQSARLELARALAGQGDLRAAYDELMALRGKYPRGAHDGEARQFAYAILAANPEVTDVNSAEYRRDEAALLLREGEAGMALEQVRAGLSLSAPPAIRAELAFLQAMALRPLPAKAEAAFKRYLQIAPQGPSAPAALRSLALIYWGQERRELARAMLGRLVAEFPNSRLAPSAMLKMGRILEEDKKFAAAWENYIRLIARYPQTKAAEDARFRAPWMYYMMGRYDLAAKGFAAMRARAVRDPRESDMFAYWEARSLEKSGARAAARKIYSRLALGIDSNYYPALAARKVDAPAPQLPAASAPDFHLTAMPAVSSRAAFHVVRVLTLRQLGLKQLEPAELRTLAEWTADQPDLRGFVLAGFEQAGAYYDAIVTASRMETRGELNHDAAERVRYPRAYWELIASAARKNRLDPYLVLALVRQESWFNPEATSASDARGLMQLLPVTAKRVAGDGAPIAPPINLYDPGLNVELGSTYLAQLFSRFHGDEARAVAAYNAGGRAVDGWDARFAGEDDEWVENIGYLETREYVKRVIGGRREYRLLYPTDAVSRASSVDGRDARSGL